MTKNISKFINFKNYIYFYVFLLPFTYFGSQLGIVTGILIVWWLYEIKKDRSYLIRLKELFKFKPTLFMILFLIFVCITYFWSENKKEFYSVLNSHKYFFFIMPIIFSSLNKDKALIAIKILGLSFGIYGVFSFLIYLNILSWDGSSSFNPKFLFRYMITGIYLVLGTFLLFYFNLKNLGKKKITYFSLSIICLVGVFTNDGRSAQLSLILTLILFILFNFSKIKLNIKRIIILSVLIVLPLSIIIYKDNLLIYKYKKSYEQLKNYDSKNNYMSSTGIRIKMYIEGIDIFLENNILIGVGAGDFKRKFHEKIKKDNIKVGWMYNTIHNIYVEYLIKYGLIGFSLFLFSFIFLFSSFKKSDYLNLFLLTIIPILIVFMFDSILVYKPFNNVFIMIFTLLCVIGNHEQKRIKIE
ncbi:O-antigen ligase [Arcobacter sp. LA11]|uniref:O-antigen ligase family protein n=1 Tax=Arcobacter sp. LA11 TaxID=1898176 RepID=UPI0009346253|nr:O-antigen ligase family protein [Arcobacter sp. LA11]